MTAYLGIPIYYEYACSDCPRGVTLTDTNGVDFQVPQEALWN